LKVCKLVNYLKKEKGSSLRPKLNLKPSPKLHQWVRWTRNKNKNNFWQKKRAGEKLFSIKYDKHPFLGETVMHKGAFTLANFARDFALSLDVLLKKISITKRANLVQICPQNCANVNAP
jgi:hypothetical protein